MHYDDEEDARTCSNIPCSCEASKLHPMPVKPECIIDRAFEVLVRVVGSEDWLGIDDGWANVASLRTESLVLLRIRSDSWFGIAHNSNVNFFFSHEDLMNHLSSKLSLSQVSLFISHHYMFSHDTPSHTTRKKQVAFKHQTERSAPPPPHTVDSSRLVSTPSNHASTLLNLPSGTQLGTSYHHNKHIRCKFSHNILNARVVPPASKKRKRKSKKSSVKGGELYRALMPKLCVVGGMLLMADM